MAGNAPSNDLHILKIPLAFFGLHRGTADPQAVQRLENYIAKLKKELRRHALKAIEAPNYFLPEDFKQALSAMPIALFRVGNEFEMPVDCAAILFEHAYLAFHAYRQRPQEGKSLLDILQSNPEYIYHLLAEEQKNRTRGGPPLTFQLSSGDIVTIQDLEKMLLFHSPHWSILWLQRKFNEAFFRRILQVIVLLKNHDPGCAHCHHWLQTQHLSPEERTAKILKHLPDHRRQCVVRLLDRAGTSGGRLRALAQEHSGEPVVVLSLAKMGAPGPPRHPGGQAPRKRPLDGAVPGGPRAARRRTTAGAHAPEKHQSLVDGMDRLLRPNPKIAIRLKRRPTTSQVWN